MEEDEKFIQIVPAIDWFVVHEDIDSKGNIGIDNIPLFGLTQSGDIVPLGVGSRGFFVDVRDDCNFRCLIHKSNLQEWFQNCKD